MSPNGAATVRKIAGELQQGARGTVRYVNTFHFESVDLFYSTTPTNPDEVRGWVGNRRDCKWMFAMKGMFDFAIVQLDTWVTPSRNEKVPHFRLDA